MRSGILLLCAVGILVVGCTEANPEHCANDGECEDTSREGYDANKPVCHVVLTRCYAGCEEDGDCVDTPAYTCDVVARKCVLAISSDSEPDTPTDAGVDGDGTVGDSTVDGDSSSDSGVGLGQDCDKKEDCETGECTDGKCCATDDCGSCKRCTGPEGTCENVANEGSYLTDCPGLEICGAGKCFDGGCAYLGSETACDWVCSTAIPEGQLGIHTCEGAGQCSAAATSDTACAYSTCNSVEDGCSGVCTDHTDCVANSVCDRSEAHLTGFGVCVDPTKVQAVTTATLASTLTSLPAGVTHLKLAAGNYEKTLDITTPITVTLVADGTVTLTKANLSDTGPVLDISGGANITLQGVTVTGGSGANADGVQCAGTNSSLTVVESTLDGNDAHGIDSYQCAVTLRRSTVSGNDAGGVKLNEGTFILTNNLILDNGSSSSTFGGVNIPSATSVTFINNTVTGNISAGGNVAGVACPSSGTTHIINSIIYNNLLGNALGSCTLAPSSTTSDPDFVNGTYIPQAQDIKDGGSDADVASLLLDRDSNPRIKLPHVDMGCYENQN